MPRWFRILAAGFLLVALPAACQFDGQGAAGSRDGGGDPDGGDLDGGRDPDGAPIDASTDASVPSEHLLLTEIFAANDATEFVEIYNPLPIAVELGEYYLSDDPAYCLYPQASRDGVEVPVGNFDAILKFPDDATIGPGQVQVVARFEQNFQGEFSMAADYALARDLNNPDTPPTTAGAMVVVSAGTPVMDINDGGEAVVLFRWNAASDLVTDIDIVIVADGAPEPPADNSLADKDGIMVDGPDRGSRPSIYRDDAHTMQNMEFRTPGSYKRIALEGTAEVRGDGNGVQGHDETSEDTRITWEQTSLPSPPTPGEIPESLR